MRNKLPLLLLLLLATLTVGCTQDNEEDSSKETLEYYETSFNEGSELLESKEYELAIEKFELALGNSDHEPTLLNLAKAHYALEQYEEALNYINTSIKNIAIDTSEEYRVYGDILFALGNLNMANEQYSIATELDVTNAYAWYGIGLYYETREDYYQFFDSFEDYFNKFKLNDNDIQDALHAFEKATTYSEDAIFYSHLMGLYIENNNLLAFFQMIPSLYEKYPHDFNIAKKYGEYLDLQSKEDEALKHFKAISEEFNHSDAIILVPEYMYDKGQYEACIEYMEANDPYNQNQAFIELYANAYFASQEIKKAYSIADEVIKQTPESPFGYLLKGKLLYYILDFEAAVAYFEKVVELDDNFEGYNYLLTSLYKSNQHNKFQSLAYDTISRFGFNGSIVFDLFSSHNTLGQYDQAANLYIQTYNYSDTILIEDARKYYVKENYIAALEYSKVTLKFDPEFNTNEEFSLFLNSSVQLDNFTGAIEYLRDNKISNIDWLNLELYIDSTDSIRSSQDTIEAIDQWIQSNLMK